MEWIFFFVFGWAIFWFLLSVLLKRNDIADTAWGLFPIFLGGYIFFTQQVFSAWIILYAAIFLWGARLSWHIAKRTFAKKEEDFRYKKWRETWKYFYVRSFVQVFLVQTILAVLLSFPLLFSAEKINIEWYNILGIFIFACGFLFEAVSDAQLKKFIAQKKQGKTSKKIITSGLWKYSRHPNYFGEVVLWWGVFMMALVPEKIFFLLISPLLITILILKVSGVPMAEARYKGNAEWEEYAKKTSVFFPWWKK